MRNAPPELGAKTEGCQGSIWPVAPMKREREYKLLVLLRLLEFSFEINMRQPYTVQFNQNERIHNHTAK